MRRRGVTSRAARRRTDAAEATVYTRGLTKRYGDFTAVDHLNLEVHPGEIFGLLGPNGAGKTTTVLMLLGLSEPSAGQARVVGLDPRRQPLEVKRRVGYLPDNVGFYGGLSGRANLRYTGELNGLTAREADARADELLAEVGLSDAAANPVETYSRGMRQRLGIADALVKDPSLLILDEPTIAIDPAGVAEILALIRRLVRERGLTVLLSSHLLEQVQSICDRVGIFVGGRLIAQGRVGELAVGEEGNRVALEVGVAGDAEQVETVLRGVTGVTDVRRDDVARDMWLVVAQGDVRGAVSSSLVAAGLPPTHLRRRGDELETIYRRLVEAPPPRGSRQRAAVASAHDGGRTPDGVTTNDSAATRTDGRDE